MGTIQDARQVLVGAEASLRQLIEQSLKNQRYADVAEIAYLADGVARLLSGRPESRVSVALETPSPVAASAVQPPGPVKRTGQKVGKAAYPRFERDGDKLVKIGWSKKNKESYEHRAPREAVVSFARHLCGSVGQGKVFMVENLMPVPDVVSGSEVPAYQVYLTLAWLRHAGVIDKKGRDGYVLRRGALQDGALDKLWSELPTRAA